MRCTAGPNVQPDGLPKTSQSSFVDREPPPTHQSHPVSHVKDAQFSTVSGQCHALMEDTLMDVLDTFQCDVLRWWPRHSVRNWPVPTVSGTATRRVSHLGDRPVTAVLHGRQWPSLWLPVIRIGDARVDLALGKPIE
eukprot:gene12249-2235_t